MNIIQARNIVKRVFVKRKGDSPMKHEEKRPVYIICPRCELNYITKKDKLCTVCKAEMGLLDKTILIPDEEETEKICPICKVNVLGEDEEICFVCQKETVKDESEAKSWLTDEEDTEEPEIEEISLEFAAEEEDAEVFDEEIGHGFEYGDEFEEDEFDEEYEDDLDEDFDDYDDEDYDEDEDLDEDDLDEDEDL